MYTVELPCIDNEHPWDQKFVLYSEVPVAQGLIGRRPRPSSGSTSQLWQSKTKDNIIDYPNGSLTDL